LAVSLGLGCGGAPKPASPSPNGNEASSAPKADPKSDLDLDAAMAREAKDLTERAVEGPEHAWSAKVPGAAAPKVSVVDDVHLVEIPIGSDAMVRCQVHPEPIDTAGTLYGVLKESAARVEYRQVTPAGVKLVAGWPAAFLDALYVADAPGGKAAGGLKLAIQTRGGRSLFCLHDEVGFKDTFQRVSTAFFESFQEPGKTQENATFTEVSIVKLDDTVVGYNVTVILPGEKPGERMRRDSSSNFVPTSPKDVMFEDTFNITHYNAKGQIADDTFIEASQGELTMQLKLSRGDDGKYSYDGKINGKPVQGKLATPKGLTTTEQTAATLRKKLKAGGAFSETVDEYHPSIDPTAVVAVTYAHAKDAPPRQVTSKLGERVVTGEVDDDGIMKNGWFGLGKRKITIERARVAGHP
jgi:hypothetical protein